jgi:hypothetical protein
VYIIAEDSNRIDSIDNSNGLIEEEEDLDFLFVVLDLNN